MKRCETCNRPIALGSTECRYCAEERELKKNLPALNSTVLNSGESKTAEVIFKLACWVIALPILAFVLGAILSSVIPGCHVDEGAGGSGCIVIGLNLSRLVAFLKLGGFVGIFFAIPAGIFLFLIAAISNWLSERK